jgi:predicted dinucleotide-utilizing enzyme
MTGKTGKQRSKLKTFEVTYCVEQGFSIIVNAASAELAEEIVEQRLDDECDVLEGSTRVHYDGFVASSSEVKP